jgi:hypothetical protein
MADPDKITEKTLINQGEGEFLRSVKLTVNPHDPNQHPLSLLEHDRESKDALEQLSQDEWKKYREGILRMLVAKGEVLLAKRMHEMQDKVLVTALKVCSEALSVLQGDATQRVEITKRTMTPDELAEMYKQLPTEIESEDVSGGKTNRGKGKRSKRLAGDDPNISKDPKGGSGSV